MSRFSTQFEQLAVRHVAYAAHQSLAFDAEIGHGAWRHSFEDRTFTIGERTLPMMPIGTTLPEHGVLAWCWADSSLEPWPWTKEASWRLRLYGIDHDIPEFATSGVRLGDWDDLNDAATRLLVVALGVLGARGSYGFKMRHGGGFFVLTDDPALPAPQEPAPELAQQVLSLAAAYFPDLDQMEIAAHYAEALGGRWTQIPGGLSIRFATGGMSLHYASNRLQWIGPSMA